MSPRAPPWGSSSLALYNNCRGTDCLNHLGTEGWAQTNFFCLGNPFRVHNVYESPSWLEPFRGRHPPAIQELIADIQAGRVKVELRENSDVKKLLGAGLYRLKRGALKVYEPIDRGSAP